MSASRGRGWFSRGKDDKPAELKQVAEDRNSQPRGRGDFAVDIFLSESDDQLNRDAASAGPLDDDQRSKDSVGIPAPPTDRIQSDIPVRTLDAEMQELPASSAEVSARPAVIPPIAEVIGGVRVPQIVIGTASPEVEPKYTGVQFRSFPFRPDTVVDGWSIDWATVRSASLRGHFHRYNSAPRQDDFAVHQLTDGRLVALVADGVSQSHQSHLGATAVVRAASRWLETNAPAVTNQIDWLAVMKDAAWALAEQARVTFKLDGPDPAVAFKEMSTTLLCAVIEPVSLDTLRASIACVGDSGAWLLRGGSFESVLGGKAVGEGGISSSAVVGLPQVPTELSASVIEFRSGEVLLLGTDGFGDPLGNGSGGVGNLFRELLGANEPPSLIEFARALDFSRETFDDDRTLVAVMPRTVNWQP